MTKLKGITWNYSRGLLPMIATAQLFTELNRDFSRFKFSHLSRAVVAQFFYVGALLHLNPFL